MKFKIIPNEQTPKVPEIDNIELFFSINKEKIIAFKEYAETLSRSAVGLAANQTSLNDERFMLNLFAIYDINIRQWKIIINPYITEYLGLEDIKVEGCLTWKDKMVLAKRSRAIKVNYYTESGNLIVNEIIKGFTAQIWQHEVNHLNGIEETIVEQTYKEPKMININRNDLCPCGSGKKYKKCCIIYG